MTLPHHDISIRKRIHKKKQKYPHPNPAIASFDRFIIILGFVNIIATLPQVLQVWLYEDSSGISIMSWAYYSFFAFMLLGYGIIHREKPIIINYAGGSVLYTLVLIGAVMHR